jgi:hypothetical protein
MPYVTEFVPADVFLIHDKAMIYHAYKEDDYNEPLSYHFSLSDQGENEITEDFDIRDFPSYRRSGQMFDGDGYIKAQLRNILDAGELDEMIEEYKAAMEE